MIKNASGLGLSGTLPVSCFSHAYSSDRCWGFLCLQPQWAVRDTSDPHCRLCPTHMCCRSPTSTGGTLHPAPLRIQLPAQLGLAHAAPVQQQSSGRNLWNLDISNPAQKSYHTWMYIKGEKKKTPPFYNIYKTLIVINVCLINTPGHRAIYSPLTCNHSPCSDLIMQKGCSDAKW